MISQGHDKEHHDEQIARRFYDPHLVFPIVHH